MDQNALLIEHVSTRDIMNFSTGGAALYLAHCRNLADIIEGITKASELKQPIRVIGQGTKTLMSDGGYPGVILHNQTDGLVFIHDRSHLIVDSGTRISNLVTRAASCGYSGLEFLVGAPGSIGGAIYRNLTFDGRSIGDYVKSATLFVPKHHSTISEQIRRVDRDWFDFEPGSSRLSRMRIKNQSLETPIILSVTLQLSKISHEACVQKMGTYYAKSHWPNLAYPNVQIFDRLELKSTPTSNRNQLENPNYQIETSWLRNWKRPNVAVCTTHPNYICNLGMATSKEAQDLMLDIQTDLDELGIKIAPCFEYVGAW